MRKRLGIVCFFLWPCITAYANPIYPFDTPKAETRFTALLSELRCLVCQNQSLADSNATLAKDLRDQIYQQIQAGQSDEDIRHYLTQRYGNFILYRPPLMVSTFILWVVPFICLVSGLFFYLIPRYKSKRRLANGNFICFINNNDGCNDMLNCCTI